MPNPQLRSSPILEVVCEFRFRPDSPWDWTIPGRLASELGGQYPQRRDVSPQVFTFSDPDRELPPPSPERIQFLSEDGLSLLQTGPRLFSVNRLAPYPGWTEYVRSIRDAVGVYCRVCGRVDLSRIGLLYIDRLETTRPQEEVFTIGPKADPLPPGIDLTGFFQRWDCRTDEAQVEIVVAPTTNPEGYVLQLDSFREGCGFPLGDDEVFMWLEKAHEIAYNVFVAALTPDTWRHLEEGR